MQAETDDGDERRVESRTEESRSALGGSIEKKTQVETEIDD
jgi:hypothetical protein